MKAKGLRNVVVPQTMKYTVATFKNCDQLKTARVEGVGYKPNKQKWKTMTNTAVNRAMFKNCRKLQKVTLTNNITHLNEQIFANCIRLKKVNIPTQCRYIGEGAFLNCKSLQKVTVSKKCKVIGKSAFLRCSNLKKDVVRLDRWLLVNARIFVVCMCQKPLKTLINGLFMVAKILH